MCLNFELILNRIRLNIFLLIYEILYCVAMYLKAYRTDMTKNIIENYVI